MADNCRTSRPQVTLQYKKGQPGKTPIYTAVTEIPPPHLLYPFIEGERETGWYFIEPCQAINLVPNPTFFNDLGGWDNFNSRMQRTNEWAFDSGYSLRLSGSGDTVTPERREYAEIEIFDYLTGIPYVASGRIYRPQQYDTQDILMGTISIAYTEDDGMNFTEVFSQQGRVGFWDEIWVATSIPDTATNVYLRVNLRTQDQRELSPPFDLTGNVNQQLEFIYADTLQFEQGVEPTTFFHGDTIPCEPTMTCQGGYRWIGTPHASQSERSACARDGGKLIHWSELGVQVISHTGHSAPPVRDIDFTYTNRPGSFYQKTAIDPRILTFNVLCCDQTLEELECCVFDLQNKIMPNVGLCTGKFLLVYRHGNCRSSCNSERDSAICVTYIGGAEGDRVTNHEQRMALQFKAHDPEFFAWPGHSSVGIDLANVTVSNKVLKINSDGTLTGFPIQQGITIKDVACLAGQNRVVIGGEFDSIDGLDTQTNLAIFSCDEICQLGTGFNGQVCLTETNSFGDVIVGGDFTTPFTNLGIFYGSGGIGSFPGYPGSTPVALQAPFWGQVVVADDNNQIHILDNDFVWQTFDTNGLVNDIAIDIYGNIVIVGEFTQVDDINASFAAIYNVNVDNCLDLTTAVWESTGSEFNAAMNSVAIDTGNNAYYLGGDATITTPTQENTCIVTTIDTETSKGNDQQLRFTQIAGNTYEVELRLDSFTARNKIFDCLNDADTVRITATNPTGGAYNILITNPQFGGATIAGPNVDGHLIVTITVDVGITIGEPCATQNPTLETENADSNADIVLLSTFDISNPTAGLGVDDAINNVVIECLEIATTFQGDDIQINNFACITNGNVTGLGNGISEVVNDVFIHPETNHIWVGTASGIRIWNGFDWCPFAGEIGNDKAAVSKITYCQDDCSIIILHDQDFATLTAGNANAEYLGNFENYNAQLVVHGPGNLEQFNHELANKSIKFCTQLTTGEIATYNFGTGAFSSNVRPQLGHTVLPGSTSNIIINKCDNPVSLYMDGDSGCSGAVLLWRDSYWGIEGQCCQERRCPPVNQCCEEILFHREPDCEDSPNYPVGQTLAHSFCGCITLYVNLGEECEQEGDYIVNGEYVLLNGDTVCIQ